MLELCSKRQVFNSAPWHHSRA